MLVNTWSFHLDTRPARSLGPCRASGAADEATLHTEGHPTMKSYEVIGQAVDTVGAKKVAAAMGLSPSLVYKWCEAPRDEGEAEGSGAANPMDRLLALWECTRSAALLDWLCVHAGGTFVPDPARTIKNTHAEYVEQTQTMIHDFSELLGAISESIANDGRVDPKEADTIRREWQKLKAFAESFVVACERGMFDKKSAK